MKKFLLGIFLLASISTFAQGVRYGAKMGMNFSTLNGDAFENSSTRYGFAAGIFAEIPLGSAFQFQPELLYSGQGIKPNTGPEGNFGFDVNGVPERPFDERAELDYIQLHHIYFCFSVWFSGQNSFLAGQVSDYKPTYTVSKYRPLQGENTCFK